MAFFLAYRAAYHIFTWNDRIIALIPPEINDK
jgi:hypothetical protein